MADKEPPKPPAVVLSKHTDDASIAVITLQKEPVNSMNLAFWEALQKEWETANNDPSVRAIIFQSGLKKKVFTAGLDIKELYGPATNEQRLKKFWATLTKVLVGVYSSQKITVAAIAGACPAGGCCLALCCDYRVITNDGAMGLNEVALGIPVPRYWIPLMAQVIGHRHAERVLTTGVMIPCKQLVEWNMVDAVVENREDLMPNAVAELRKNYLRHPDAGRQITKHGLRAQLSEDWAKGAEAEAQQVWDTISSKETIAALTKVLKALSGGPKKAKM